jgi:hypothetical protein
MEEEDRIDEEELDAQAAELLPDREVMSAIKSPTDPVIWDLPVEPRDGV